jgi:DNA-binding response OmpR family regulator
MSPKKKILLAEDDASISKILGDVLEMEHYEVMRSRNGRETAAAFIAELPELVLLDLNMPDRNGWEVYDLMHRTHPSVPVIIITALSQQHGRAADLGVMLMEKPLDIPMLLETIRECLAKSRVEESEGLSQPAPEAIEAVAHS